MRAVHAFKGTGAVVLCGALFLCLFAQAAWAQDDPVRIYNQACRLSRAGDQPAALEQLRQAMAAGFDDLRFAEMDPDLRDLRNHPDFLPLLMAWSSEKERQSSRRSIQLESGLWSGPRPLEMVAGGAEAVPPTLDLRWQPDGLQFRLSLQGEMASWPTDKTPPPWQGGPGLVVTLTIPDTSSRFESRNHFLLAFGLEKSTPVGALYSDQLGWQRVLELDPEVQMNPGQATLDLTVTIPWQAIQPYHPLVDTRLGINAAVRVPSGNLQAELFPDPQAFRPDSRARRYAPLTFAPESQTAATHCSSRRREPRCPK